MRRRCRFCGCRDRKEVIQILGGWVCEDPAACAARVRLKGKKGK